MMNINDSSVQLNQAIKELPDGGTLRLSPDKYLLCHPLEITNKKNITLEGNGATLVCHFDAEEPLTKSSEGIHVSHSENLTLHGFTLTTDQPVAVYTHIVDFAEDHVDLQFDGDYLPTQREFIQLAIADDGHYGSIVHLWPIPREQDACVCIANEIVTTNNFTGIGFIHEWLDERTLRLLNIRGDFARKLQVGMRCSLSFSYYGLCAMVFRNVNGLTIEDVSIPRFGGMGFVVLPRCRDFTFKNVKIAQPSTDEAFNSSSSDGIHTTGLGGFLKLIGCTFNYTRDDPLNLHTQFLTVTKIEDNNLHLIYNKPHGNVSADWVATGDRLQVYDPVRCCSKGFVIAAKLTTCIGLNGRREAELELAGGDCDIQPGDLIDNTAYYADLTIQDCTVESYRRGFVIQSASSVLVKNNHFVGGSMNVYISANYGLYLEAGHVSNAIIENNCFSRCQGNAVMIRVGGPGTLGPGNSHTVPSMVHKNISIRRNVFEDNQTDVQINANGTDGLEIIGNVFRNCGQFPIAVEQCDRVKIQGNREES